MLPSAQPHCLDAVLTPTHRSPISRMLLRYRWQSCSTWGQKDRQWAGMASPKGEGTDTSTEPYFKENCGCCQLVKCRPTEPVRPKGYGHYSHWGVHLGGLCEGHGRTSN